MKTHRFSVGQRVFWIGLALCWVLLGPLGARAGGDPKDVQIFAFNDLGMHCYDNDFSVFSLLPPFNVIHGQVIQRGSRPKILDDTKCALSYMATRDPNKSINTTSRNKTNFWQYSGMLYGVTPPVDTGILGATMPGAKNKPQPMAIYDPAARWFTAPGIPLTNLDDKLKPNAYSMMCVRVSGRSSGKVLSDLDIVVPASCEMNCASCHVTGQDGASDWHAATYNVKFSANPDPTVQSRENILLLHDGINGTDLFNNRPVLCAGCHYSHALDLTGSGPSAIQKTHKPLSLAMHSHHGKTLDHTLPTTDNPPILPENGAASCYSCHPGGVTNCLRGAMSAQRIVCQDCHGGLLAVGGEFKLTNGQTRRPWMDMPKCQSCHTGDVLYNVGGTFARKVAYDPADPAATPLTPAITRFAENKDTLFRNSSGHYGVACESCHGSPHAEWPAQNPKANDNLTAIQLQGHTGPIAECGVCHTGGMGANLSGPHGLHNVNSSAWMTGHKKYYYQDPNLCRSCHGQKLEGTALARAGDDRKLQKTVHSTVKIKIAQGTMVSCALCHGTRYQ